MRTEREIKNLRNELSDWVDMITKMHPNQQNPTILTGLVMAHDALNWALGNLPRKSDLGLDFENTIDAYRETMAQVKEKQHKHRDPLSN